MASSGQRGTPAVGGDPYPASVEVLARDSPPAAEQAPTAGGVSAPVSDLTGDMPQLLPPSEAGGGLEPWITGCWRLMSAWAAMSPEGFMAWFTCGWVGNMLGLQCRGERKSNVISRSTVVAN